MAGEAGQLRLENYKPRAPKFANASKFEEHKAEIVDLYIKKDWSLESTMSEMEKNYPNSFKDATDKHYRSHLHKWGEFKTKRWEDRMFLYKQIMEGSITVEGPEALSMEALEKLSRHYTKDLSGDELKRMKRRLRKLKGSMSPPKRPATRTRSEVGRSTTEHQPYVAQNAPELTDQSQSHSFSPPFPLFPLEATAEEDGFQFIDLPSSSTQTMNEFDNDFIATMDGSGDAVEEPSVTFHLHELDSASSSPLTTHRMVYLNDDDRAWERLVKSCGGFYDAMIDLDLAPSVPQGSHMVLRQAQDPYRVERTFFVDVKNEIYYYKIRDTAAARQLVVRRKSYYPQLRMTGSIVLLRELLSTLSLVNTETHPALRNDILREFVNNTNEGHDHSFGSICRQLANTSMTDQVLRASLINIFRVADARLPPDHSEIGELWRALIKLHRRLRMLGSAASCARDMIFWADLTFGVNSATSRLARTELVHILKDDHRYEPARILAEHVVRAYEEQEPNFPGEKAVSAMEDLASIWEKLEQPEHVRHWLNRALAGARALWGDNHAVTHIQGKLRTLDCVDIA